MSWPPFHPSARQEFDEAFDTLAVESAASARHLVERTGATLRLLRQFPRAGRPIGGLNRRFPVRPFPFHVVYLPERDDIYIVAFANQRRRPEYWAGRTSTE